MSERAVIPHADGVRLHWLWQTTMTREYRHVSVFVSTNLDPERVASFVHFPENNYLQRIAPARESAASSKVRALEISPDALSDIPRDEADSDVHESATALLEYLDVADRLGGIDLKQSQLLDRIVPPALEQAVDLDAVSDIFALLYDSSSSSASCAEWGQREATLRDTIGPAASSGGGAGYDGPLFVYEVGWERSDEERTIEPRAPINVVWRRNPPATAVECGTRLRRDGWSNRISNIQGRRHAVVQEGGSYRCTGFDDYGAETIRTPTFSQWHCRLFDIPDGMDPRHNVAGNTHRDPAGHGKLHGRIHDAFSRDGPIGRAVDRLRSVFESQPPIEEFDYDLPAPDWRFDDAKGKIEEIWSTAGHDYLYSAELEETDPSFNGEILVIT